MINFLNYRPKNCELLWDDIDDTKKNFIKRLASQPKDWIYRKKKISYKLNEQGFREKPFKKVRWDKSVVIIGCSIAYGEGLALEDNIASQLSNILSIPVINLSISGSAIDLALFNSTILNTYYPKPKAIVHIWTSPNRYTHFSNITSDFNNKVPWHKNYDNKMNWEKRSKLYIESERAIWKNTVPRFEGSFFDHNDQKITYFETLDLARDLHHPGIVSNLKAAKIIADQLKEKIK